MLGSLAGIFSVGVPSQRVSLVLMVVKLSSLTLSGP